MTVVDMLDATGVNAGRIPRGTKRVAIYLTGSGGIAWTNADVTRLVEDDPELQTVYRIVQANNAGDVYLQVKTLVIDIEPGAATLGVAIEIAKTRAAHGLRTAFYYFKAEEAAVRSAVTTAGLESHVDYWLADWNYTRDEAIGLLGQHGIVAVQYSNGHYYDYSVTLADWPTPVKPLPAPQPPKGPKGTFKAELALDEHLAWTVGGTPGEGVVLGGPDVWDEARVGVNRKTGAWRVGPLPLARRLSRLQIHPKVAAAASVGAPLVAIRAALSAFGVHVPLSATEQDAVAALLPVLAAYLKSSGVTL